MTVDASIVYFTSLTGGPLTKRLVFHTARGWTKTRCGLAMDTGKPEYRSLVISCRRDRAELIATLCLSCMDFRRRRR